MSVDVQKFDATGTGISLTNTATVAQASTTTTLAVPSTSVVFGQPITLTATVAGTPAQTPGGTVVFRDGTTILGLGTLDNTGNASLTTTTLAPGGHSLSASYLGDSNFSSSASTVTSATVRTTITGQVAIALGPIKRKGGKFTQLVTLTNLGSLVNGPIFLVFDNLSRKVKVKGAAGTTTAQPPLGSPFVPVNVGPLNTFATGQQVALNLVFSASSARLIRYNARVLAGNVPV
jgi:hypothetical protein